MVVMSAKNDALVAGFREVLKVTSCEVCFNESLTPALDLGSYPLCDDLLSPEDLGPGLDGFQTVGDLVTECLRWWPGQCEAPSVVSAPHEAGLLALATEKARSLLGWQPRWSFVEGVEETMAWYKDFREGLDVQSMCLLQITGTRSA